MAGGSFGRRTRTRPRKQLLRGGPAKRPEVRVLRMQSDERLFALPIHRLGVARQADSAIVGIGEQPQASSIEALLERFQWWSWLEALRVEPFQKVSGDLEHLVRCVFRGAHRKDCSVGLDETKPNALRHAPVGLAGGGRQSLGDRGHWILFMGQNPHDPPRFTAYLGGVSSCLEKGKVAARMVNGL